MKGSRVACAWLAPHRAWHVAAGFTLWSLWFVAAYGALSVACAVAPPAPARGPFTGVNLSLLLLTLATVALLLAAAWQCWRGRRALRPEGPAHRERAVRRRFLAGLSALLYLTAAAATAFVGLPLLWLPPCV
ncbi:hypothetical protein PGB34_01440 [Xenophilus arseniciresistens]|uniref:Uncharacterized protein n=1 Tax=Xenophilus arseniciresistens TaxID=1283306 RepID=A0AAE3N615_9BURK|nr:hypothetical protein [Xenophilus arseniciresistens]MDA7415016.1 hypothetical protein [Xenophilus arseniciresistens]